MKRKASPRAALSLFVRLKKERPRRARSAEKSGSRSRRGCRCSSLLEHVTASVAYSRSQSLWSRPGFDEDKHPLSCGNRIRCFSCIRRSSNSFGLMQRQKIIINAYLVREVALLCLIKQKLPYGIRCKKMCVQRRVHVELEG